MRILKFLTLTLVLILGGGFGAALSQDEPLTLDQILERYTEALGGRENIKALQNIVFSHGSYVEGDYSNDGATMSVGRPWFKLVGDKNNPGGYMEGYDGSAWEYFADPGVVIRTAGPPSAAIRHYAGVERPLFDYREKGSVAELLGEMAFDGGEVYVIKLIRRDGYVEQFYLDKETFLVTASGGEAPIHAFGDDVKTLTRISDYKPLAGVMIAHRFETVEMPSGEPQGYMQWGKIEVNVDLPADWFSPPKFERTKLERFIEDIYGQRTDLPSMMWTYDVFHLAYPGVDTNTAVNIAGFQTLKMGQIENAIGLLEQNTKDNPESAETRFGLGRAYRTGGRLEEARAQFEKALELDPDYDRARSALEEMGD